MFVCLFVCFLFALIGLACLAWGVFLPLLALLVIAGVVQRCLFSAWRYLALFGFAGVAGRSCTLPFANALSVLLLARWVQLVWFVFVSVGTHRIERTHHVFLHFGHLPSIVAPLDSIQQTHRKY